jgi:hypothetical protein
LPVASLRFALKTTNLTDRQDACATGKQDSGVPGRVLTVALSV